MSKSSAHQPTEIEEEESSEPRGRLIGFPVWRQAASLSDGGCDELAAALQQGEEVQDGHFDRVYEGRWREPSEVHWSSISIVRRVVELLSLRQDDSVLDVGSGVGKFCLAGSLISPARFVGVERRPDLVRVADRARRRLKAYRSRFMCQDALEADWTPYSCIYLFNPYEEHLMEASSRIDNSVTFSQLAYISAVNTTRDRFERLSPGTRVVLFWGYGDEMLDSFELLHRERLGYGALEVWRKR